MMRLNIGSGFQRIDGFVNVDCVQCIDDAGNTYTDVLTDIEKDRLPFENDSIDEIACYELLEHLSHERNNIAKQDALIYAMNEMWRVLKPTGFLKGKCPHEGGNNVFSDPTHQRVILADTFDYFCGVNKFNSWQPARPRKADYGTKPWYKIKVDKGVNFILRPRKTKEYDENMENL
jgi:SAM-dependent methyltransferase